MPTKISLKLEGYALVKEDQIDGISKAFNSLQKKLWFTVDKFENENVNFLHIKLMIIISITFISNIPIVGYI